MHRQTCTPKNIEVHHHLVSNNVEHGVLEVEYCPIEEHAVDVLTKRLSQEKYKKFNHMMGMVVE